MIRNSHSVLLLLSSLFYTCQQCTSFFTQFVRLLETWHTIMQDCECLIIVLIAIGGHVKLFGIVLNNKNIERLLSLIDYHWQIFTHSLEKQIMHDYAIVGKKMTISYAVSLYTLMSLYMLIPIIPKLLDLVKPLNKSRPNEYLFDVDYSFDRDEYYYVSLLHSYLTTVMTISIMVIIDTIYIVFAQHVCSLFAAIGRRLENLGINSKESDWLIENIEMTRERRGSMDCILLNKDDEVYRELIVILQKHQLSIEYVSILDSTFALYSLILLALNIIVTSLLGLQILSLMDHKKQMIRFASMCIGAFMHLFVLSYPGQKIIDHSTDVFHKAYNMQWYKMSRRSIQLLSILLYRCYVPCTLTAGKVYVLSMANYASMVQTSISYFTAFLSLS
ncbi:odorant receptor 4-like isoform X2 [Harpegnathos saltator]|uniref:odorant receptor 4-like isoform X2 n=1 Tax=Harpegnathos saltator TaxID=610380 RepID=UPI000DBED51A|nr:odorant receptor 4-like isoform X2 [Harpegnathos saltator]